MQKQITGAVHVVKNDLFYQQWKNTIPELNSVKDELLYHTYKLGYSPHQAYDLHIYSPF